MSDEDLKNPERALERRRLEKIIGDRFSYEEMSRRALGEQWKQLTEEQKHEFIRLFQTLLANSYAGKIEGYTGEQMHFLAERLKLGYAEVQAKIVSKKMELPLDFRLIEKSGDWRVFDIVVDGVSLINNYRGQLSTILRASSYAQLVERLREKSQLPEYAQSR
ncbi:MAG: organic solvent tolerance ABC transporter substrate-binding protein [Nitrospiraceae bacterium]